MELNKIPQWMLALEPEDAAFLKNFVLKSGSLKDIARLYQSLIPRSACGWTSSSRRLSWPTSRRRNLHRLYQGTGGGLPH
mgnify:CR=1 FL=1